MEDALHCNLYGLVSTSMGFGLCAPRAVWAAAIRGLMALLRRRPARSSLEDQPEAARSGGCGRCGERSVCRGVS